MSADLNRFGRYVIPAMLGMAVSGIYTILDTVFIGKGMGETGLAAIALSWPLTMIFMGLGELYGAGASVLFAQARGANHTTVAPHLLGNTLLITTFVALLLGALFYPCVPAILIAFGGTEELLPEATIYTRTVLLGSCATVWMTTGIALIRADGRPLLAMCLMGVGFGLNILLDWLFILVFHRGACGAGSAFVVSQSITALLCILYFYTPLSSLTPRIAWLKLRLKTCWRISVTGAPIFGNQLSVIAMLFLNHVQALRYGGVNGLAGYTVVATLEALGTMILTGLASGMQPLVAEMYGAHKYGRMRRFARYAYTSAFLLGIAIMLLCFALRTWTPQVMGLSDEVIALTSRGILISSTSFLLLGIIRVAGFYTQATGHLRLSTTLIYGDSLCILPLCLLILPCFFGMDGVWLAMPTSRLLLCLLLLLLRQRL